MPSPFHLESLPCGSAVSYPTISPFQLPRCDLLCFPLVDDDCHPRYAIKRGNLSLPLLASARDPCCLPTGSLDHRAHLRRERRTVGCEPRTPSADAEDPHHPGALDPSSPSALPL
jgi:hypothetical protein